MEPISLTDLASQKLDAARRTSAGRSSTTVHGGREHRLKQTLIAMCAGQELAEHSSPGEATLQVISGGIVLRTPDENWAIRAGETMVIPDVIHSVEVPEDSVFLLTVAKKQAHLD